MSLLVVGASLAALVAADERARRGLATTIVHTGGPWGGHFAGVRTDDGALWDAGMVGWEFSSYRMDEAGASPPLAGYDADRRNDVGRFCHVVREWVARRQDTREIAPPQMWLDGRAWPDALLANRLDALPHLPCAAAAREELRAALPDRLDSPLHACRKDRWARAALMPDADTASRFNHGRVLHDALFAPFARQVLGRDAAHLAAPWHRVAWLPLYWPHTLLAALQGRPDALAPTPLFAPAGETVAALVRRLADGVRASPQVRVHEGRVDRIDAGRHGVKLTLGEGPALSAQRLAWTLPPQAALGACGVPAPAADHTRLPLLVLLLAVPRDALRRDFSALHCASDDTGLYRVCNASRNAGDERGAQVRLTVEANRDRLLQQHGLAADAGDDAIVRALLRDLAHLGVLCEGDEVASFTRLLRTGLPLPTPAHLAAWHHARERVRKAVPEIEFAAAASGPFATSLADQIVQGLRLAAIE